VAQRKLTGRISLLIHGCYRGNYGISTVSYGCLGPHLTTVNPSLVVRHNTMPNKAKSQSLTAKIPFMFQLAPCPSVYLSSSTMIRPSSILSCGTILSSSSSPAPSTPDDDVLCCGGDGVCDREGVADDGDLSFFLVSSNVELQTHKIISIMTS